MMARVACVSNGILALWGALGWACWKRTSGGRGGQTRMAMNQPRIRFIRSNTTRTLS